MIPQRSWLAFGFLSGILLILSIIFYRETILYFPSHIHAWTQSDRYAIALKFLENGFHLFKPQTFNLQTLNGVTAVDLPLPEWFVAIWMKLFGSKAPGIFRLHTLLISFVGYFFVFKTVKQLSNSIEKALLAVVFIFTCPIITYYQAGFVPSTASLSLVFIGYFFVGRYWDKQHFKDLILAVGMLTLASFIRKPFIIFLFAFFLHELYTHLGKRKFPTQVFSLFGLAFLVFIGLQVYNSYLSKTYGSMFLNELMPARSWEEFTHILKRVYEVWAQQYFTIFHYIGFLGILVLGGLHFRQKSEGKTLIGQYAFQGFISLLGGGAYFLLMGRQFIAHEYYFIDSLYVGTFLLFFSGLAAISFEDKKMKWGITAAMGLLLIGGVVKSIDVQEEKYSVWDRGEITRANFTGSEAWLNEQGVAEDARILVLDAYSTNSPLIQMNRNGYTVLITRDSTIRKALGQEFEYVVIQDEFIPSEIVTPYPGIIHQLKRIHGNGKISLFKHDPTLADGTLKGLMGIKDETIRFADTLDFSIDTLEHWEIKSQVVRVDTLNNESSHMGILTSEQEFGPTFTKNLPEQKIDRLLFEGRLEKLSSICEGKVAISIQNGAELVFYQDYPIEMYHEDWQNVQFLYKLPTYIPPNSVLKCYVWNPNKCNMHMDYLRLTAFEG